MKKLLVLGIALLAASPAMAGFTATYTGPALPSNGPIETTLPPVYNGYFTYVYTGPDFYIGDLVFTGTLAEPTTPIGSYESEARINITDPLGNMAGWNPSANAASGWVSETFNQTVTGAGGFFVGTAGTYTFSFSDVYDDGGTAGIDAYWSNLSFEFQDAPPPPVCIWGEDFNAGMPASWTYIDNTANGGWDLNTAYAISNQTGGTGTCAAINSDAIGSFDVDAEMITPSLAIPSGAAISFKHYFRRYSYDLEEIGDFDITTDGGTTWTNLAQYTGASFGPATVSFDLAAYAGMNAQFRWHYYNANYDYYWEVDDVCLTPEPGTLMLLGLGLVALLRRR